MEQHKASSPTRADRIWKNDCKNDLFDKISFDVPLFLFEINNLLPYKPHIWLALEK